LQSVQSAQTVLDLSRDMHLINTYGEHEITVVEALQEQKGALDKEIRTVSRRRVRVKRDLAAAVAKFNDLHAQALAQRKLYDEAQFQLAEFKELATTAGSPIMGPSRLTAADLAAYLRRNGYHPNITVPIEQLAQFYIEEGAKVGVRGDVAFAQSILETGGFNFAHSMVEVPDNNYAGIGACDSCHRGFIFPDARTGVRAQVQLLRVYVDRTVTADSFPDPLLLPRTLKLGFRGRVQSWWDLTGTWATAKDYGIRLYAIYMRMVMQSEQAAHAAKALAALQAATHPPGTPAPGKPVPPAQPKKP
jgi:hypothetical protein